MLVRSLGMRVAFFALVAIAAICGFVSCNTDGCSDNHSALPLLGFYSSSTERIMSLDSIDFGGVGAPNDTLLVKSGEVVTSLYIPFRFEQESTSFFIRYNYTAQGLDNPAFNDTITFRYITTPYFASEECGAFFVYTIAGVDYTHHLIDSVAIVDSVISNVDMERIKVFIRTADASESEDKAASMSFKNMVL